MNATVVRSAKACWRALKRVWFLITESDPPEKPKPGIRIFARATPRAPRATGEPPIDES